MRRMPKHIKDAEFLENTMALYVRFDISSLRAIRLNEVQSRNHKHHMEKSLIIFAPPDEWIGFNNTRGVGWLNSDYGYKDREFDCVDFLHNHFLIH